MKTVKLFLLFSLLVSLKAYSYSFSINGPNSVYPDQGYHFSIYNIAGQNPDGWYSCNWYVNTVNGWKKAGYSVNHNATELFIDGYFTYRDVGNRTILIKCVSVSVASGHTYEAYYTTGCSSCKFGSNGSYFYQPSNYVEQLTGN